MPSLKSFLSAVIPVSVTWRALRRRLRQATLIGLVVAGGAQGLGAATLRAAAVKVSLTPAEPKMLGGYGARESTGVNDPIHHRVLLLESGDQEWVLVSSEFCVMSPAKYDEVAARLEEEQGLGRTQFWWTLTHTHSAPEVGPGGMAKVFLPERYEHRIDQPYTDFVVEELVAAIAQARARLQPATLGLGWGYSSANINRRARDIDGITRLGMNPDGAVDRRIGLLRVDDLQGAPIALVANYPIHGTVLGGKSLVISGDAPGVTAQYVEEHLDAPMLFINGAAGNLAPIYSVYPSPQAGHLSEFRRLLGDRILAANALITSSLKDIDLSLEERIVEIPMKAGLTWSEDLMRYHRVDATGAEQVRMPIRILTLNQELAIWAAPVELFCEVSNEIRERSSYPFTYYFGYTNGWLGYLMTDEEREYGGYELRVSPFAAGADQAVTEAVLSALSR